jgi:thiol-disulfide isomerase/thioredoxin
VRRRALIVCASAPSGGSGNASAARDVVADTVPLTAPSQQPWWQRIWPGGGGGKQQQLDGADALRVVDEAELEQLLASADATGRPLVVVFSAHWCGPCAILQKTLARADPELLAKAEFVKIEAPDAPELCTRLKVHALPCTFFVGSRGRAAPAMRMEGVVAMRLIEDGVTAKAGVLGSDLARAIQL